MEYCGNQHHILKYLCKLKYGVTNAHLKCLSNVGNDVASLNAGAKVVPYSDCIVEKDKLRQHMEDRKIMSKEEFDIALSALEKDGYIDKDFKLTVAGENKNKDVFKTYYASQEFLDSMTKSGIADLSKVNLLFND